MPYQLVLIERDDQVATVTLNRAEKRNALNTQLRDEISAALGELEADDGVSVAVLTGAGPVFCAGFDTKEFETTPPSEIFSSESSRRYHHRVQHFTKPLIAAVNGPAMGGGFDLAVLCDVRIAAETAAFGHPEIKFGAPTLFGPLAAVSGVVPGERLLEEARAAARTIAEAPPATLRAVKAAIVEATGWKFEL